MCTKRVGTCKPTGAVFKLVAVMVLQRLADCQQTTCTISTSGTTTLTCLFAVDVNHTSHDFRVEKYSPASSDPTYPLICVWDRPQLHCQTQDEYSFNQKAGLNLILEIPEKAEGEYVCLLVPLLGTTVPCVYSLAVKVTTQYSDDKHDSTTESPVPESTQSPVQTPTDSTSGKDCESNSPNLDGYIGGIVFLVIFILALFIVFAVIWYKSKSARQCLQTMVQTLGKQMPCCPKNAPQATNGQPNTREGQPLNVPENNRLDSKLEDRSFHTMVDAE